MEHHHHHHHHQRDDGYEGRQKFGGPPPGNNFPDALPQPPPPFCHVSHVGHHSSNEPYPPDHHRYGAHPPPDLTLESHTDEKYSTRVKDADGHPCFALVNKATGEAMKHSVGATHPVQKFFSNFIL
ncbi:PREDICTED: uncharacterized histidine-rich protein DDB_G0274557-like isoform X2 [Camelina sativa]|uniref:Uncharacterized histidine-rich protein DDB_G0274557-like isoform X2 n=1 Tax=Camelina sativa TaxID=90675 RepID=A0ABM0V1A4_CAMSA|nr:PREDICTED: uncharacterized histidine-rich protein DDB_G0274557-like isoform X2 [Camelina sativa]